MRNCAQGSWAAGPCKLPNSKTKVDSAQIRTLASPVAVKGDRKEALGLATATQIFTSLLNGGQARMSQLTSCTSLCETVLMHRVQEFAREKEEIAASLLVSTSLRHQHRLLTEAPITIA